MAWGEGGLGELVWFEPGGHRRGRRRVLAYKNVGAKMGWFKRFNNKVMIVAEIGLRFWQENRAREGS